MARVLADGITGAQLLVIPGVRHFSLIEAPHQWPALADWLTCGRINCP